MKLRRAVIIVALLAIAAGQYPTAADVEAAAENGDETAEPQQPVSEAPIKLVHVLNPGEREYLSPNLIGVQNIAITHLPLTMNFINIIDAFREIVNGVRYEILLNAVDTKGQDAEVICRLVILEKPWLRTQWGDKVRELEHSNCTSDAENDLNDSSAVARSKALNDKYESNALFNGGSRNELSDADMVRLEAQIMPFSASGLKRQAFASTTTTTTTTTVRPEIASEDADPTAEQDGEKAPSASREDDNDVTTRNPEELSESNQKFLNDFLTVGALSFEQSRQDAQNLNSESKEETSSAVADESNSLQQATPTDQSEVMLQQREQQDTQQQESEPVSVQFENVHARSKRDVLVGGVNSLDQKEAEERLKESLNKLAEGDGPSYRIDKIHLATTQLVSGTLTKIVADLVDANGEISKECNIEIWSQPWLKQGSEVTVDCPNKKTLKTRYRRNVEWAEKKTHKKHNYHNLDKAEHLFNKFQVKYNRQYHNSQERQMRLRIFKQNLKMIEDLNRNEMGSAKYGITEFADMTSTEYKQRTGLWQRDPNKPSKNDAAAIPDIELPKEFDWREKGAISEVKNQGSCGSCWAFSVTGNIEGLHAVKTGKLEEYSEQELLDCDTEDSACNGGLPDNAYDAILKIGGLELESEYPYHGRKEQCKFNKAQVHVKVKGAVDLPKNETAMQQWLLANGPVSIGINANAMQFYRGGVSHPWKMLCSHKNLDHGVLIVGYGVSEYPSFNKVLPYWIVKNSWGPKWGEQGYYRVYRGDNTCGLSEMASSAVLADD